MYAIWVANAYIVRRPVRKQKLMKYLWFLAPRHCPIPVPICRQLSKKNTRRRRTVAMVAVLQNALHAPCKYLSIFQRRRTYCVAGVAVVCPKWLDQAIGMTIALCCIHSTDRRFYRQKVGSESFQAFFRRSQSLVRPLSLYWHHGIETFQSFEFVRGRNPGFRLWEMRKRRSTCFFNILKSN